MAGKLTLEKKKILVTLILVISYLQSDLEARLMLWELRTVQTHMHGYYRIGDPYSDTPKHQK